MEKEDSDLIQGTGSALQIAPMNSHQVDEHLADGFKASGTSPPRKSCCTCGTLKPFDQYYSKGKGRIDSSCISCSLKRKKELGKKKKARTALLNAVRKNSRVLTFSEGQIIEKTADNPSVDIAHLDSLLRQFIFDSLCRTGVKNE